MKTKLSLSPDYLTGEWRVTAFHLNTNLGWKLSKQYALNSFSWKFCPDGQLFEKRKGNLDFNASYTFNPDRRELYIDRTGFDCENILSFGSRYSVKTINENECYLYDLDSVAQEPHLYKYRMKIKRFKISAKPH